MDKLRNHYLPLVILVPVVIFITIFYFNSKNQIENSAETSIEKAEVSLPLRLKIPKINVDSAVEFVGLTPLGVMDVPKGPLDVAWFNVGPRPGETGSAVLAGHSGFKDDRAAVFDDLYLLEKGDYIYVEDKKGITIVFVVRDIKSYDPKAIVPGVFNSNDGKAHLNLITCTGIWNETKKTHSDRLVVFADREME